MSQSRLSRIENGEEPRETEIEKVAEATGFSPRLFRQRGQVFGGHTDPFHRKRASVAVSNLRRNVALLNLSRLRVNVLCGMLHVEPSLLLEQFDDCVAPREAARELRRAWGIPSGPIHQLIPVLEAAGIFTVCADFGCDKMDGMGQWVDSTPIVLLNTQSPPTRLRLTGAHELGHIVLHSERIISQGRDIESEAFEFGEEFLAPQAELRPDLRGLGSGSVARCVELLASLKRDWKLSMAALLYSALKAKLITQGRYVQIRARLRDDGMVRQEPLEPEAEHPALLPEMLSALLDSGVTREDLEEVLWEPFGQLRVWAAGKRLSVLPAVDYRRGS